MVPVKITNDNPDDMTVSPGELQFTPENWNTGQPVTVYGKEDADTDDETGTVKFYVPGVEEESGDSATDYSALRAAAVDLGDVTGLGAQGPVQSGQWDVNLKADELGYFKFTLSQQRRVGVRLASLVYETGVFLEDSNGTVLASATWPANQSRWLNEVLDAGDYYLRIEVQYGRAARFGLRMGTAGPDSITADSGTSAVVAVDGELADSVSPFWDIDWVRVDFAACGVFVLEVRGASSSSGTLIDPELQGVYVDPADTAVHNAYVAAGRLDGQGVGRISTNGVPLSYFDIDSPDYNAVLAALVEPNPDRASVAAHDLDDGAGQDAWLLFRPETTGSHYIEVVSQGGFEGSYTVSAKDTGVPASCRDAAGSGYEGMSITVPVRVIDEDDTAPVAALVASPDATVPVDEGSHGDVHGEAGDPADRQR